jgi:hypothetical protein
VTGDYLTKIAKSMQTLVGYLVILFAAVMVCGIVTALFKIAADLIPIPMRGAR